MKEIDIKTRLVKFLLTNGQNNKILGSEVRFNNGSRRADIVAINEDEASVYEIKGSGDSVDRLDYQLVSYKEYFDFCYIVCEPSNIQQIQQNCPTKVGILVVSENMVKVVRKAQKYKRLNKLALTSTLHTSLLRKLTGNNTAKSKHELCVIFSKKTNLQEIKKISRDKITEKLRESYLVFLGELGETVNPDDILTLTRMPSNLLSRRT